MGALRPAGGPGERAEQAGRNAGQAGRYAEQASTEWQSAAAYPLAYSFEGETDGRRPRQAAARRRHREGAVAAAAAIGADRKTDRYQRTFVCSANRPA